MSTVRNTNDGTDAAPRLRVDLNMGGLSDLPAWSAGPVGVDPRTTLRAIKAAGYAGIQGGDIVLARELGLGCTGGGRINQPGEVAALAAQWKQTGYDAATVHVGWGHESDAEIDALVHAVLAASTREDIPIYIELHRATITQDTWRTVQMVERHPGIRFNADFSHWYSGLEMPYGNWEEKLAFLQPVFDRVGFLHGRCGNSSHMQVALNHPSMTEALEHFRDLWTRSFAGFLRAARPGDYICFAPELLSHAINYAQTFRHSDGTLTEASDRWLDAQRLGEIARECFASAQKASIQG
ncbi:MAG: hypothetical protein O3B24_06690 [Verrucomicrobia bacterium]|nr:hypothetical protein [Verrucomicrobiota bacterium]